MNTIFEDMMTSLDEAESYMQGNREGFKVHAPVDIEAAEESTEERVEE